jgi:hypothetical protein
MRLGGREKGGNLRKTFQRFIFKNIFETFLSILFEQVGKGGGGEGGGFASALKLESKEVNKEQPSYRNLSATATRVLQCTCPVAASWKYFSAIHPAPQLTSTHLTPDFVNTMILHLVSVLYSLHCCQCLE